MELTRSFEILGLKPGASLEQVKEAYRDLVKVWHPDRFAHDPKLQAKAQEKLKEINEANERVQAFLDNPSAYHQSDSQATPEQGYARADASNPSDTTGASFSQPPPDEPAAAVTALITGWHRCKPLCLAILSFAVVAFLGKVTQLSVREYFTETQTVRSSAVAPTTTQPDQLPGGTSADLADKSSVAPLQTVNLQEGKWLISSTFELAGMQAGPVKPQTFTTCLKPSDYLPTGAAQKGCSVADVRVVGNTVTWTTVCKDSSGKGRITYAGSTFDGTMDTIIYEGGNNIKGTIYMSGQYIGPCQ